MDKEFDRIVLEKEDKEVLLSLARKAIESASRGIEDVDEILSGQAIESSALDQASGLFVTLRQKKALRGCIGTIQTEEPLYRTVVEYAISSAIHDPRFPPLKSEEVECTDIEISVLSSFRIIDEVEVIEVGTHGLYIQKGSSAGLLLPQVAIEWGWDRREFLEQCCRKAGIAPDAWEKDDTEIMIFNAVIFREDIDV